MRSLPWILFLGVFGVGVVLSPRIGPAWDEPDNMFSAGVYERFFQQGFNPQVFDTAESASFSFSARIYPLDSSLSHLPPLPNYVGLVFVRVREALGILPTGAAIITAFHWSAALFFGILVAYTFLFARLLGLSTPLSLTAALFAYLYPTLFGHGYSNTKDIAQASLFTVSLYYLVKENLLVGAVAWGLALATKFNAIYVPIIWGIWKIRELRVRRVIRVIRVLGVGLVTAFVVWPYLWGDPMGRALEVVRYFTTVGQGYYAFWNGVLYQVGAGKVLWWYPWVSLFLVTPIPLLILGVLGVVRELRERRGLLLIWVVVPMVRAFLPSAAFYDGIRHFMEILPAWTLMAAVGLEKISDLSNLSTLRYVKTKKTWALTLIGGITIAHMALLNITLFPYSTGYYNFLAKDPNVRFDRDIEALSVKEGVEYLHKTYGAISLWSPIGGHLSWYYLTPQDRYVYRADDADSIILVNKSSHIREREFETEIGKEFKPVYVIKRGSAVFAWIYRRK